MEGAEGNRERFNLSLRVNGISRDMLYKFMNRNHLPNENEHNEEEEDEEIELNLGLSMNGRFGVDPARKMLRRSSSISNLVGTVGSVDNGTSHQARGVAFDSYAPLVRTCSLPTETEEWRRQKELQSVRHMEARRKRMEKLKNVRVVKDKEDNGNGLHADVNGILYGFENGNGPSRISDQRMEGSNQNAAKGDDDLLKNALLDMPYVSTKAYGNYSKKIEGFLYRYKTGEEVRIVCVCHGMFLSPAEFVKHGGGGDVDQPLKHIIVNPFPIF